MEINNPAEMAEHFNTIFASIGSTLAKSIQNSNLYANKPVDYSINLLATDSCEVGKIIKMLKNSAPGYDCIKAKVLKQVANLISQPLAYLINLSIRQGVFPNSLKKAVVSPIFKSKSKKSMNNYRPVSVLPAL